MLHAHVPFYTSKTSDLTPEKLKSRPKPQVFTPQQYRQNKQRRQSLEEQYELEERLRYKSALEILHEMQQEERRAQLEEEARARRKIRANRARFDAISAKIHNQIGPATEDHLPHLYRRGSLISYDQFIKRQQSMHDRPDMSTVNFKLEQLLSDTNQAITDEGERREIEEMMKSAADSFVSHRITKNTIGDHPRASRRYRILPQLRRRSMPSLVSPRNKKATSSNATASSPRPPYRTDRSRGKEQEARGDERERETKRRSVDPLPREQAMPHPSGEFTLYG